MKKKWRKPGRATPSPAPEPDPIPEVAVLIITLTDIPAVLEIPEAARSMCLKNARYAAALRPVVSAAEPAVIPIWALLPIVMHVKAPEFAANAAEPD